MKLLPATACAAALLLSCCGPVTDPRTTDVDLVPPQVTSVCATDADTIRIAFDEDATLVDGKTRIEPELGAPSASAAGQEVVIHAGVQSPGRQYTLEAEARDAHGNTASFLATFFGYNPHPPRLLINELSPRGSDTHPDFIELLVTDDGDMGGVALFLGTPSSYDARLIFPSFTLGAGSYVTVHLKPTGDPLEVDEPGDPTLSGGADTSTAAWDFWMRGCKGLGANNGAVSVFSRPGGECLDAVLYSNRTSQSDQQYRGFGSTDMMNRADELSQLGSWTVSGTRAVPEDAINPEGSTGTRSLCRTSGSDDTNAAPDWHVVPTRKASPGAVNSDDVYTP
jgi:hypothetical protein